MRILIVSQYFWPENFRVNDLAAELSTRGHQVSVLTGVPNYPEGRIFEDFARSPKKYANHGGIDILRVPLVPRGKGAFRLIVNYFSFALSACLFGVSKVAGRQYDVIFVYQPSPITIGIPAILLKCIKKTPIVFWVLDLWPETLQAVGVIQSPFLLKMVGMLVKFIYRHCDLILAQSQSFIKGIGKYCGDREKIRYFPSWSEELFNQQVVAAATEIEKRVNGFTIMFAGNIGDAQDFPTILSAAEQLRHRPEIRWIIVGDGRMASWVKEQIAARELQGNVIMAGRHPLSRMPSFFAHADALLVSLKANEVFSMTIPGKIQTYLSSGLPIIGALDGEGQRVVREAGAGYTCRAGDARGLAAMVDKMAGLSREDRNAMGKAGKEYYAAEFEKKLLIDKLESYFNEMRAVSRK